MASRTLIGWWRGDFTLSQARGAGLVLEGRRDWIRAFRTGSSVTCSRTSLWLPLRLPVKPCVRKPTSGIRQKADVDELRPSTKQRLYTEARIPEYWLVDCAAEAVEIHRDPGPEGYRELRRLTGPATLALLAFPDVQVTLAEIFA